MAGTLKSRAQQPLFNAKVIKRALQKSFISPSDAQRAAAADWAERCRNPLIGKIKEEAIRGTFTDKILIQILGYLPVHPSTLFNMAEEEPLGMGSVDIALGRFMPGQREVVAPFELKGPKTRDLDVIMPGRAKSPVQQAWEYAIDAPGAKWVIISNCIELRLYAFGRGRSAYETWNFMHLDQPGELERLLLLLSADSLLGAKTEELLDDSQHEEKSITDELYKDYKAIRDALIDTLDNQNPTIGRIEAIEHSQTLLDRALFIAFAEDMELLPRDTLKGAFEARNPFAPQPIWDNFKGLFRAIDQGAPELGIPAYNGGLFAPNKSFDTLSVPDEVCANLARFGDYDFATEVSVLVLGRIFEQSVTDLETMQANARGEQPPTATKRKREGVVYTPEFVTRFIIEQTVGRTLAQKFDALLISHDGKKKRQDDGAEALVFAGKATEAGKKEREFWEAYQTVLRTFTVLDPACGSGAFLVAAFDFLSAEYNRVNQRLADLSSKGTGSLFDPDHEILSGNLFGVDVSRESIEITKLSLWLKTAKRGKLLESLEANIRVGNSIIEDAAYHHRNFTWHDAFPWVFEQNGFDVVVGNPPYVRMELIKPFKPYLALRYEVVSDRADLYAYFFELGLRHLKPGGRLGYISSSTFFRTGSAEPLRVYLTERAELEIVVDFGDLQLFDGVTTYPAIAIMQKPDQSQAVQPTKDSQTLRFLQVRDKIPEELSRTFEQGSDHMPRNRLGRGSWQFESDGPAQLRAKLRGDLPILGDVYGLPLYGIKTGLNDAFVVDRFTRDRLAVDEAHAKLLVPFLRGEDVRRWRVESSDLWLINTPRGRLQIDDYPAIKEHLIPFKDQLEARATKQEWFELQQSQFAYQARMREPKIVYPHFANTRSFAVDHDGFFSNDKTYLIPGGDLYLSALLNSNALWFILTGLSPAVRGGYHEQRVQYIEQLPIPEADDVTKVSLAELALSASSASKNALAIEQSVRRRLPDLCPPGRSPKLTTRLQTWWKLDFAIFRAEVKKSFQTEISLKDRHSWEEFLSENRNTLLEQQRIIASAEQEIDRLVNELFGLTDKEQSILFFGKSASLT
jgi:hypothetical protein